MAATNVSAEVCASCHSSVVLNRKYGMPTERFKSFEDSFHGLASRRRRRGRQLRKLPRSAQHQALQGSSSTINKPNLAVTCGQCHPGANENFTKGSVHLVLARGGSDAPIYWIKTLYIGLIILTIGGMSCTTSSTSSKSRAKRLAQRQGKIPSPTTRPSCTKKDRI